MKSKNKAEKRNNILIKVEIEHRKYSKWKAQQILYQVSWLASSMLMGRANINTAVRNRKSTTSRN